ncbi:hypothetical protein [Aeromonas veronii]|uniref:hypothetical protein n=1 Tax=Aeromonas veronii TaxID=654 RepID=UPI003D222EE5
MFIQIKNINTSDIETNTDKQYALSNLLRSHYSGFNIVNLDLDDLDYVLSLSILAKVDLLTAHDIRETRREYGRVVKNTTHYIQVDFSLDEIIERNEAGEGQEFLYCSYHKFSTIDKAIACTLVSECLVDAELYKIIGKYYSSAKTHASIPLKFKIEEGRGSGTKPIFERLKTDGYLCLCVLDSDKKHPKDGLGGTAKVFTSRELNFNGSTFAKIIPLHEAESLLPYSCISEAMVKNSYSASKFDALDKMVVHSKANPNIKLFIDHKNGICAVKSLALDSKYGEFWSTLPEIKDHKQQVHNDKACDSTCIVLEGLGDNILDQTIVELQRMSPLKLKESLEPILIPIWDDLGKLIFSWGCAPHKVQSRA